MPKQSQTPRPRVSCIPATPSLRRSQNMARIKGTNTTPERIVREVLSKAGLRYRLHSRLLPGRPDIVFPRYRKVVFVHGCFWHRHTCSRGRSMPSTNSGFWIEKFRSNIVRDRSVRLALRKLGWNSILIWECETKDRTRLLKRLLRFLGLTVPRRPQ